MLSDKVFFQFNSLDMLYLVLVPIYTHKATSSRSPTPRKESQLKVLLRNQVWQIWEMLQTMDCLFQFTRQRYS